ncbi:UNVERIFIED_CONTAM: hypothetical protein FKN15_051399 [Acipenser sinensis]
MDITQQRHIQSSRLKYLFCPLSLQAGFGVRANNLISLSTEWRGLSWSIGGNNKLDTVTTLPNILKHFNPSLIGFSTGTGKINSGFNMAVSGAKAVNLCPCSLVPGEDSMELSEFKRINREYQEETERLVSSGRYDGREDFTVVVQPFFRNSIIPLATDGKPDLDFFSVDCFHFKERGQAEMSIELWHNMLEPVGQKHTFNNFTHDRSKLKCPSQVVDLLTQQRVLEGATGHLETYIITLAVSFLLQERPYFFTQMNSFPDANPTAVSPAPPNIGQVHCVDKVPQWLAAVMAGVGLLVGAVLAGLLVSWKARVSLKQKEKQLEMKQTTF